ncbi:MAG: Hint domain-containing protein, partial [Planctomycetota bacterium]
GTAQASLSLSEQSSVLSAKASNPDPADDAVYVGEYVTLSWTAGLRAVSHDVYFSMATGGRDTGIDAVANADTSDATGIYRGRQAATSYTPIETLLGWRAASYYWRIDEVDSEGNITKGDVWTFSMTSPQPPKGRACFTADTGVWIDGKLVPISKVAQGQINCGVNNLGKIREVQEHNGTFTCYDVLLESGNCIGVAENHYFLAESGQWISLKNLKKATRLQTPNGSIGIVSISKRPMPYIGKVYNIKVEGSHRYMVGKDAVIVRDY